jgi:PIN domain nuclease of toxin-antitoxin system
LNFVLDTNILICSITEDPRLDESLKTEIKNQQNRCLTSIASLWEISIKHSINKLILKSSLEEIFKIIDLSFIEILPISRDHILQQSKLKFHHRDPFDRLIIAQAQVENLTIITKDSGVYIIQCQRKSKLKE